MGAGKQMEMRIILFSIKIIGVQFLDKLSLKKIGHVLKLKLHALFKLVLFGFSNKLVLFINFGY